jgi:cobyrinic acid a,c-diamide synthase
MLEAIRAFAAAGGLVIGEAGGLLYLSQSLQWQQNGQRHPMGE